MAVSKFNFVWPNKNFVNQYRKPGDNFNEAVLSFSGWVGNDFGSDFETTCI